MLRTATCLCVLQVLLALREPEVAHLIPDQPIFIDTPTVPHLQDQPPLNDRHVPAASASFTALSEEVAQGEDPVDLSKMDLAKLEELPNCSGGELRLSAKVYKATRHLQIQEPCNVTADGTILLLTTTLKFVETARLDGRLSVRAMDPLQGPCLAFKSDAFVAASAELHFENCHNIVKAADASDAEAAEVDGGAMNVNGSLTVMGALIIRDCSTKYGKGGAIAVKQDFFHSKSSISIINSSAGSDGGGIVVGRNFTHSEGNIAISNSSARGSGGGIVVRRNFTHSEGNIAISNSSGGWSGGGIAVSENFVQSGGTIFIQDSLADNGGGIEVYKNFMQSGGNIVISNSLANEYGGGIVVGRNFMQSGVNIVISNSSARWNGGGIWMHENFMQSGGTISIQDSLAESGGGIYATESFTHTGGKIAIGNSSAERQGGGIYAKENFTHSGGKIAISNSSASKDGGGIWVYRNFMQSGGNISIQDSLAESGGGICVLKNFKHSGGSISISFSYVKRGGGGLHVGGNVVFANAKAKFSRCHAQLDGGGIEAIGNVTITNSSLMFELATASGSGAALLTPHLEQSGGDMTVYRSSGGREIIDTKNWTMDGGTFHIQRCSADAFLLSASTGAALNATEFVVSDSSGAGMLISTGEVTLRNGIFNKTSSPQVRAHVVRATNCRMAGSEAMISSTAEDGSILNDIDCDDGFGGYVQSDGIGCRSCNLGLVLLKDTKRKTIENRSSIQFCELCPAGAKTCNATVIEMSPGMMVEGQNISRGLHCPNALACPGGAISSYTSTSMCTPGYKGPGCSQCTNNSARSDSNVFICLPCGEGFWRVKEVLLFLAGDAVIFIISAAGVINAQRRNKDSAVYVNQLMSFAAVTAPALLALKQTATFKEQLQRVQRTITFVSIPVQAGDAGDSSTTFSTGCLQRYMGLEPSLALSQALSSSVYVVLTLCLAVKSGMSVALVVGINCFLPKFCAAFGKYLIYYRMEPASINGEKHWLLDANRGVAMAIATLAIMVCFIVGPGSWMKMTRDKSLKDQPQVLFLTRSYRKGFETWEVERLIRRMLLKMISTTLPITLNPSMQMAFATLVLIASLLLHSNKAPYAKAEWNQIEISLLVTALLIVVLTTLCLANEIHWAHSADVQSQLILLITGIAAIAGGIQSFLLIRELIRERWPPPLDTPEPIEPKEQIEPEDG